MFPSVRCPVVHAKPVQRLFMSFVCVPNAPFAFYPLMFRLRGKSFSFSDGKFSDERYT